MKIWSASGQTLPNLCGTGLRVLAVLAFISLKLLLDNNLEGNEIDVLPLARQFADPSWVPGDWYLNQPPGYRLLFQALFGRLIVSWGFLATSIVGRLACYGLVALGLVLIGKKLGLSLPLLLLAVGLFVYTKQAVAASEWIVGGLEAKSVAYGLVLLAIALMLTGRYRWTVFMLGLATSFHVLVGAWTFLTLIGWLTIRWNRLKSLWHLAPLFGLYLLTSAFAVKPVLEQLFTTLPPSTVTPSYIYVFLRLPHHLNPLSWSSEKWIKLAAYLLVLALCIILLQQRSPSHKLSRQYIAQCELYQFTLLSLVPFMLGLAISPFDSQGSLLQYYPFRLGDVMLSLNTYLLFACTLQQAFTGRGRQVLSLVCIVVVTVTCSIQSVTFYKQYLSLNQLPPVEPEFIALCDWVRTSTPTDTTVVSPPANFYEFTWLAERPTIAKFKLLPQTKAGIIGWYERLNDLSSGFFGSTTSRYTNNSRRKMRRRLTDGYNQLTTAQVDALMTKYQATYFMSSIAHQLDLPKAYSNSHYVLYARRTKS